MERPFREPIETKVKYRWSPLWIFHLIGDEWVPMWLKIVILLAFIFLPFYLFN
jgi:hypothetical protein